LNAITFRTNTSEPAEHQFWEKFDALFELNETEMYELLPLFSGKGTEYKFDVASTT